MRSIFKNIIIIIRNQKMASLYSNLSSEKDNNAIPVFPQSRSFLQYSNPPKIQYQPTYTAPRKHP